MWGLQRQDLEEAVVVQLLRQSPVEQEQILLTLAAMGPTSSDQASISTPLASCLAVQ